MDAVSVARYLPANIKKGQCVGLFDNMGFGHSGKISAVRYGRTYMETENSNSGGHFRTWGIEDA